MFRKKLSKEDFLEARFMFWYKTLSKRKCRWYSDHVAFETDGFTVYDDGSSENLEKVISEVKTNVYHNDDVKIRIIRL